MPPRFDAMFSRLARKREGAFIPFAVLGDPDPANSLRAIETLVAAGADALELGFPFSDPIADGPAIRDGAARALAAGATPALCFHLVRQIRGRHPEVPIGLLVYANLAAANGVRDFFHAAANAGADSVLLPDVPLREAAPFRKEAETAGLALTLILPLHAEAGDVKALAAASRGFLYLLSRKGVTGTKHPAGLPSPALMAALAKLGAAPPVLGFGISKPEHVRAAMAAGCRGVVCGSAIVETLAAISRRQASLRDLERQTRRLKAATRAHL